MNLPVKFLMGVALLFSATTVFSQALVPYSYDAKVPEIKQKLNTVIKTRHIEPSKLLNSQKPNGVATKASVNALYERPSGVYSMSYRFTDGGLPGMFVPLKKEIKLTNKSTGATSYEWEYAVSKDNSTVTSTSRDLTFTIPLPLEAEGVDAPYLTAISGSDKSTYAYGESLYAGSATLADNMDADLSDQDLYRFPVYDNDDANMMFGSNDKYQWSFVGEKFDAPVMPVLMSGVALALLTDGNTNVDATVNVYKINNKKMESVWKKTLKLSEFESGKGMQFSFETPILINTEYYIGVEIPYSKGTVWTLLAQNPDEVAKGSLVAYAGVDVPAEDLKAGDGLIYATHSLVSAGLFYPYMYNLAKDGSDYYYLPDVVGFDSFDAGTVEMYINSPTTVKSIVSDASWFKIGDFSQEGGVCTYTAQMDAADDIRLAHVTVTDEFGFSTVFTIGQGEGSGINSATVNNVTASYDSNMLNLNYDASVFNAVEVYNIAGVKVAESGLNGQTSIPVMLNNGVYVVKLLGSTTATIKVAAK